MKNAIRYIIRVVVAILVIALVYVGGNIGYGLLTDFQPPATQTIALSKEVPLQARDSVYTFMIWNIGYAGLGADQDFFYDGGKNVRPTEEHFQKYLEGVRNIISANGDKDFILIQEIDTNSKRSYYFNELEAIENRVPTHNSAYATNYHVDYVPMPLETPWNVLGKVRAGLATFSRYQASEAVRHQFPGQYPWWKRIFILDRCFLVERFPLPWGKDLLVVNTHNSAYDDGTLKQQEMAALKTFVMEEYGKGNYVVVGGDWNQLPPGFDNNTFKKKESDTYEQSRVPEGFPADGWQFAYDAGVPTNRKLAKPYDRDSTFCTVIDYFLLSPNVEVNEVRNVDLDFRFSDHQPVYLEVRLK